MISPKTIEEIANHSFCPFTVCPKPKPKSCKVCFDEYQKLQRGQKKRVIYPQEEGLNRSNDKEEGNGEIE